MRWLPSKPVSWIGITILAATAGILYWFAVERRAPDHRLYRIGWSPDPPFQAAGPDGRATGLAIELVREAARRRGVRLEWVRVESSADAALRDGTVDLWPLLTLIPERTPYLHISESYLETEHCFLVRAESGFTERRDLAGVLVSFNDLRINRINLQLALPSARPIAMRGTDAAIESVCQRRSDAAFVDEYSAIPAMLGGLACAGQELLLIATPEVQVRMGVGSTFAAWSVADAIRDEIGHIAAEPNLPPPLLHWSYFSRRHMETLQALREAKKRQHLLITLAAILFSALLIVGWLSQSTRRERRRARCAERELDATQRSYRLLTEQAADGVFLVDRKGKFLVVNVRLCEMLGYTKEEILQMTVLDTCLPEEREAARFRLENTPGGAILRFERHLRCKDGSTIPIEASVVRLQDGNSQGIIRDIAERKRAHHEALARHKLESVGLLASGIAHDFNNLLGSILTTAELVLSDLPEDSPAVGEVRAIQRVAERGAGIVRQMMSYAGQNDPAFESVDLGQVIKEMIDLINVSISKNAVLKVDLPEDLPAVWGNAAQIRQVVMNLVINASEALGENEGRISVTAEPVFSGSGCDGVRLKVTDTGCGITDEIRSKMFDPFFTTKFAGRGLGLSVVQGIVRSHGGVLEVTSAPSQGCRIEILLPRAADVEMAGGRSPQLQTDGKVLRGTILVIEDEDALRHAVSQMLRKMDLKVVEAREGERALEAFDVNPSSFDVVLLDMTLPGVPSREILAQLRRIRPDLKVIITSAYGMDEALSIMGELQPWLYIRKPYQFTDLAELLSKIRSEHDGMATAP